VSAPGRRPLIAGNWKMHKTLEEARQLAQGLVAATLPAGVDVAVCPPFTALAVVAHVLAGSRIALGAQTMHEAPEGAFTGEISPVMLRDVGVRYVILGHSERRQYFNETDAAVARKVRSALDYGLLPIVAVGETAEEHAAGATVEKVVRQTRAAFAGVAAGEVTTCVVAYEPIWAIGTGNVDAPENANAVMERIRECVPGLDGARILYGGSMKGDNAPALMAQPNIDGGLIGGASLTLPSFLAVIEAARPAAAGA
jgi:triosephosphate isomerase (TIM)